MQVNLNNCFPEGADGTRGPLPKQSVFLHEALNDFTSKYIAYVGGVGSGKTFIGCITVLSWAVMHQGDYLIGREFFPELRDTTLKTFLEICPPELLVEHRVADGIVKIKAANGKVSNVLFRHLEEPDKLKSLNLSGFYIDEASQVSEDAFLLLQGRLRGAGLRKGIITSNPNGHDWIYRWFLKKDHIKRQEVKDQFFLIKAPSTENFHLPEGYVEMNLATWSEERIKREIYGDFDVFEGQVYPEFSRNLHVVKPFVIPDDWERVIGIDHGYRNPACWLWGALDYDGNLYIYREFYESEWTIPMICNGKIEDGVKTAKGVKDLMGKERIQQALIDPSTDSDRGRGGSDYGIYIENLNDNFPLVKANNAVNPGIDRVKTYLKPDPVTDKPTMFIFDTCVNLLEEFASYRWQPKPPGAKEDYKEKPVKKDDHACDALRYLIMGCPEKPSKKDELLSTLKTNTIERSLYEELQALKKKGPRDDINSI